MTDESFDPKSWLGPSQAKAQPSAAALPEFWSGIGNERSEPAERARSENSAGIARKRFGAALAASGAILALTALAAWQQRAEPNAITRTGAAPSLTADTPPPDNAIARSLSLSSAADLPPALLAAGIARPEVDEAMRALTPALDGSGEIRAVMLLSQDGSGYHLERLNASFIDGSGASLVRDSAGAFAAQKIAADLTKQVKILRGELDSESFYTSAIAAGLVDTLVPEFINAFAYDFNLASEVSPGDTFEVAYEQSVNDRGDPVGTPKLLYASLTTPTKSLALYRYVGADGTAGWYDGNGGSTKRGFMRTPIDGARISSKYGMRFHPVLHYTRMHKGVDFAAPIGTPIYAAADGTVSTATPNGCGGNWVIIDHAKSMQTRYFHLSRYADGLHAGQQVNQGQTIGYVGVTGTCTTGPHLHYETLINGEHIDPLSVPTDEATRKRLAGAALQGFLRERDRIDVARAQQLN